MTSQPTSVHSPLSNPPFLDMSFAPSIRLVSLIRVFASQFYGEILQDPDLIGRLELATHELLENAVKYSVDGLTRLRIDSAKPAEGSSVTIRTWNRPRPDDLVGLNALLAEVRDAADPIAFYQVLMERTSRRSVGSGLGLGRIRAEAEMTLRSEVVDGVVCIIAVAQQAST